MVRFIDRPDMTLDVYCGRKTTIQQQQQLYIQENQTFPLFEFQVASLTIQ